MDFEIRNYISGKLLLMLLEFTYERNIVRQSGGMILEQKAGALCNEN